MLDGAEGGGWLLESLFGVGNIGLDFAGSFASVWNILLCERFEVAR
jgi:hypothetical protein